MWRGRIQVAPGQSVGCHHETFKKVINIGVYLESIHETVHVILGQFLSANVCMRLVSVGPVIKLVDKVSKYMAPEALDLAEVPRLLLAIIGVRFPFGRVIVTILRKDNDTWRRTYAVLVSMVPPVDDGIVHLGAGQRVMVSPHQIGG